MVILPEREVMTPFGRVRLPEVTPPPSIMPHRPDDREKEILRQGLGEDLAFFPGLIPVVGAVIADVLGDIHHREITKLLTPEEYGRFAEFNKYLPTSLALARTLLFTRGLGWHSSRQP